MEAKHGGRCLELRRRYNLQIVERVIRRYASYLSDMYHGNMKAKKPFLLRGYCSGTELFLRSGRPIPTKPIRVQNNKYKISVRPMRVEEGMYDIPRVYCTCFSFRYG